jgi:hypothetical protein
MSNDGLRGPGIGQPTRSGSHEPSSGDRMSGNLGGSKARTQPAHSGVGRPQPGQKAAPALRAVAWAFVRPTDGVPQCKIPKLERGRFAGRREHIFCLQEGRGFHQSAEPGRLCTEVAILGTAPRFRRKDSFNLHFRSAPGESDLVRQGGQCHHGGLGQCRQRSGFVTCQQATVVEKCLFSSDDHRPLGRAQGAWVGGGTEAVRRVRGTGVGTGNTVVARCGPPVAGTGTWHV